MNLSDIQVIEKLRKQYSDMEKLPLLIDVEMRTLIAYARKTVVEDRAQLLTMAAAIATGIASTYASNDSLSYSGASVARTAVEVARAIFAEVDK